TLSQAPEAYGVRLASDRQCFLVQSQEVPCHIFRNGEMGQPSAREFNLRSSSRPSFILLDADARQAHLPKAPYDFAPVGVLPDARDDPRLGTQCVRMIREVRWRPTQLWSRQEQVPQHFSDADNAKVHADPIRCPVVSECVPVARPSSPAPASSPR